jgi:hypothetical protein
MASPLDFSLPEGPRPRARAGFLQVLTFLVAAAILVLVVLHQRGQKSAAGKGDPVEIDRLKKLADDLERRTLYVQADEVWGEYLRLVELEPEAKADILYRRGKCLKEGGRPAEAARRLTEVEHLSKDRDLKRKARQILLECFAALGKQDVRDNVSRSFALGADSEKEEGTVLARVGGDNITKETLRQQMTEQIQKMLLQSGAPLTPAELEKKASEIVDEQLRKPEGLKAALEQAVSMHLLYREGIARGYGEDSDTATAVANLRKGYIADRVLAVELGKALAALGPTEVSNHYEAHKDRFVQKEGVEFSFARFPSIAEAEAAATALKAKSPDAEGKLEKAKGPAALGEPVPGIGPSAEISAHILALAEGEVSSRPVEHAGAFYVFRAEKKTPQRQLSLQEAEAQVKADLAQEKRKESLQALQAQLVDKFKPQFVEEKPPAAPPAPAPEGKSEPAKEKDAPKDASKDPATPPVVPKT